jgi:type IV pilus assembly protein PilB
MHDSADKISLSTIQEKDSDSLERSLIQCSTKYSRTLIDYQLALKHKILPLATIKHLGKEIITVACREKLSYQTVKELIFITNSDIKQIILDKIDIKRVIFKCYKSDQSQLTQLIKKLPLAIVPSSQSIENQEQIFRNHTGDAAKLLEVLIDHALSLSASDLHITPKIENSDISIRINGEIAKREAAIPSLELHRQLVRRVKVLISTSQTDNSQPIDGKFKLFAADRAVYVRVNIIPTVYGEKIALRFLSDDKNRSVDQLGFSPEEINLIKECALNHEGAILLTGATGSGKTSTLYGIARFLSKKNRHVITIEDPVEMIINELSQISIAPERDFTYKTALRGVLRQDPDVILIGELRDEESAKIAFQAAQSGHLILSTIHAASTQGVRLRLSQLGIDQITQEQALKLVIAQQLLPRLCPACKEIDLAASNTLQDRVYQRVGCNICEHSGYCGLILLAEIMQGEEKQPLQSFNQKIKTAVLSGELESSLLK